MIKLKQKIKDKLALIGCMSLAFVAMCAVLFSFFCFIPLECVRYAIGKYRN